ncbi:YdeI/OmpD-associated family protein [Phenylobacterium sp.]|uniref:YdeI/OmpD-associated family protein n=1 Tax=Phenylobacterium sp. TaxID=1871053 RepID=UPI0035242F85
MLASWRWRGRGRENPHDRHCRCVPPSYRKVAIHRVTSAKGVDTRAKRLDILIDASARGLRLKSPTQVDD